LFQYSEFYDTKDQVCRLFMHGGFAQVHVVRLKKTSFPEVGFPF